MHANYEKLLLLGIKCGRLMIKYSVSCAIFYCNLTEYHEGEWSFLRVSGAKL